MAALLPSDPLDSATRIPKIADLLPPRAPVRPVCELLVLGVAQRRLWDDWWRVDRVGRFGVLHTTASASDHLIQRLAPVLDELEPIRHLNGVGRTGARHRHTRPSDFGR
ncbi:MAG: hypothetical protein IT193_19380 [Propionibacteriaceae bacterium]|nr:hypothetical protein [Propionibacteriaceae bacterium]